MGTDELCSKCQRLSFAGLQSVKPIQYPQHLLEHRTPVTYFAFLNEEASKTPSISSAARSLSLDEAIIYLRANKTDLPDQEDRQILSDYNHENMLQASTEGCHLCELIICHAERDPQHKWAGNMFGVPLLKVGCVQSSCGSQTMPAALKRCFDDPKTKPSLVFLFVGKSSTEMFKVEIPIQMNQAGSVASSEHKVVHGFRLSTVQNVQRWLLQCKEHPSCTVSYPVQETRTGSTPQPSQETFSVERPGRRKLPSRLLKVDSQGQDIRVKLIETCNLDSDMWQSEYATLSHCWGDRQIEKRLLSSNLNSYLENVPIAELPLTFRQALVFANLIKIQFLWIDALCIIQDDDEEWKREALCMLDIYGGAVLNIAASASRDSSQGLLSRQYQQRYCQFDAMWDLTGFPLSLLIGDLCPNFGDVNQAPLNARSWVFQERTLSPRSVHFSTSQVWWQCRQDVIGDWSEGTWISSKDLQHPFNMLKFKDWQSIVSRYSFTKLSRETDRLAALSGLARSFASRHSLKEIDYVAGLFRSGLPDQLLWRNVGGAAKSSEVAPSWSWASISSGTYIEFFVRDNYESVTEYHSKFRVAQVSLSSEPDDPFNYKRSGYLEVQGILCNVFWEADSETKKEKGSPDANKISSPPSIPTGKCTVRIGSDQFRSFSTSDRQPSWITGGYWNLRLNPVRYWDSGIPPDSPQIYFLPIARSNHGQYDRAQYFYAGILLQRVPESPGHYVRVGMMDLSRPIVRAKEAVPSFWTSGDELNEDEFSSKNNDGSYSFYIV